jgi:hypothetical protein
MNRIARAVYLAISLHALRRILRKASPARPRKTHGKFQGYPVQVGVGITYTNTRPDPDGRYRSSYEYFRLATCIDLDTASALADALNGMEPGYGPRFSLIDPDVEINSYKLEVLKSDRIHLLRDNIRKCPDPDRLAKMMQSAAISVILRNHQ